jgi:uncharacterized protein YggE
MTEDKLDLIEVSAKHEAEIEADEAEIRVTVQGSSLVVGNAVFEKAREVQKLVEALRSHGILQADLQLRDVRAEVSSGLLGKSSSATYELSVRCRDLGKLPDVLGEIGEAKQATLGAITWHYPDTAAQRATWLARCVADANAKAQAIAAAVPAKIVGVHRIVEVERDAAPYPAPPGGGGSMDMSRARGSVALGFQLGQRRTITVRISASYRVAQLG